MESVDVALACETPAAAVFYTTDDTPPGPHSAVFRAPIRLDHVGLTVLRARAVREGMWESDEVAVSYFVLMQATPPHPTATASSPPTTTPTASFAPPATPTASFAPPASPTASFPPPRRPPSISPSRLRHVTAGRRRCSAA